ncbi:MAG: hypothetical protein COY80_05030 [Candidatus Pacebacteria bacterium CG_4_10_14_0_8_um_filter_42_14]|nr:MAG: hypothetical protein COY80_05030 [Candidatus Pacebacteria bacterium CG_4_10_14_0_8_um_filter_42_14]
MLLRNLAAEPTFEVPETPVLYCLTIEVLELMSLYYEKSKPFKLKRNSIIHFRDRHQEGNPSSLVLSLFL